MLAGVFGHPSRQYLLAELRCAALRARLWQADIEAVGIALKGKLVTTASRRSNSCTTVMRCSSWAPARRRQHEPRPPSLSTTLA